MLLVERSAAFARALAAAFEERAAIEVDVAPTLAEALARFDPARHFVVLTGLVLPDADSRTLLHRLGALGLPTVVVTGTLDETVRPLLAREQVTDYVAKAAPDAVEYLVWLVHRIERNRRIGALVVDDTASGRAYTAAQLRMQGLRVYEAGSGEHALALLAAHAEIRVVLTDFHMPGIDGAELTRRIRARHARERMAVIGLSASDAPDIVARFLKQGANDFIHRPYSPEEFLCRVSLNIDNLELIGTLQDLATRDFLTGLHNRRHLLIEGEALHRRHHLRDPRLAALLLDIDHFKRINDTRGHEAGDLALQHVARLLQECTRPGDVVARFGGEEFCVLAPRTDVLGATLLAERIRARLEASPAPAPGGDIALTVSVGVAASCGPSLHAMLLEADRQLYLAKAAGRNRVCVTDGPGD